MFEPATCRPYACATTQIIHAWLIAARRSLPECGPAACAAPPASAGTYSARAGRRDRPYSRGSSPAADRRRPSDRPSRLNSPEGMAVPGMISCGLVIQRSVHAGRRRSLASRKFGAVAFLSCAGSPVAWHFRQGAAVLVKSSRAMPSSAVVSGSSFCGMNGSA